MVKKASKTRKASKTESGSFHPTQVSLAMAVVAALAMTIIASLGFVLTPR